MPAHRQLSLLSALPGLLSGSSILNSWDFSVSAVAGFASPKPTTAQSRGGSLLHARLPARMHAAYHSKLNDRSGSRVPESQSYVNNTSRSFHAGGPNASEFPQASIPCQGILLRSSLQDTVKDFIETIAKTKPVIAVSSIPRK